MIKELRTQHRTIIQMSFNGYRNQEIAERLSMSQSTISNILRSPLAQAYIGGLHDKAKENTLDVRKQLISMNKDALSAFERILSPHNKAPYNVQFTTAKDILDRNGFKPTDKINIDMTLKAKSDEEIDAEINALTNSIAIANSRSLANQQSKQAQAQVDKQLDETIEESSSSPDLHSSELSENQSNRLSTNETNNLDKGQLFEDSSMLSQSELNNASVDTFPPK